jgi:hypothetical protein
MKFILLLVFIVSTAHATCDLNFKQTNLCADLNWTTGPVVNQASAFNLSFDRSYLPYTLKVDVWMQMGGHGHGSRPVVMRNLSDSQVEVSQVWFVMKGKWQVRGFLINEAGAEVERAILEVQI